MITSFPPGPPTFDEIEQEARLAVSKMRPSMMERLADRAPGDVPLVYGDRIALRYADADLTTLCELIQILCLESTEEVAA